MNLKDKIKENKKKLLDAIRNLGKKSGEKVQATAVYGDVVIVTPEEKIEEDKK